VGNLDELAPWALELLDEARVGHLGLLDDRDRPRVQPVTYVLHGGRLHTAVDDKAKRVPAARVARVRFLRRRPEAALTVDRYDEDWSALAWVQVLGSVRVHDDLAAHPGAADALAAKYAAYRERPPSGPLLELVPERVLHWRAG
jgi:PPOX class probable F420-dependent enzyme